MDLIRSVDSPALLSVSQENESPSYLVRRRSAINRRGRAVETAALMETVEKTVKGRDFSLDVFPTSSHSAWKTRRPIRKPQVKRPRRVSHSSHSPYRYYPRLSNKKQRTAVWQLVPANLAPYEIHKPDISLATKSGHFNLLRTFPGRE